MPQHTELAWLMECTASFGELRRMTQFKDKSDQAGLRVAPGCSPTRCCMAADILLYDTDEVPVGDDQRQHVELARDLAIRFNHRFGDVFVVPEGGDPQGRRPDHGPPGPHREDVQVGRLPAGTVVPARRSNRAIEKKIKRAVTDTDTEVRFDPAAKPGVSNLLTILAAATDRKPQDLAGDYSQYGPFKADAAAAVVELLARSRSAIAELAADPGGVGQDPGRWAPTRPRPSRPPPCAGPRTPSASSPA